MSERYILGSGRAPDWLRDRLTPFLAADGGTAWEIDERGRSYIVRRGDIVTRKDNGRLSVEATSSTTPQAARSPSLGCRLGRRFAVCDCEVSTGDPRPASGDGKGAADWQAGGDDGEVLVY